MLPSQIGQMVKTEHQIFIEQLHNLLLPDWKCDMLIMGFLIGLWKSNFMKNNVWAIMDHLTKLNFRGHAHDLCLAREEKKILQKVSTVGIVHVH